MTTQPDTATPTATAEQPGLAGLVCQLQATTRAPQAAVAVLVDDGLGDNAGVLYRSRCGTGPLIVVGGALIHDARSRALTGTLAHELAHLDLRHPSRLLPGLLSMLAESLAIAAVAALVLGLADVVAIPAWVTAGLAVAAVAVRLWRARVERLQEYDADTRAVELLERQDLPGRQYVEAMLIDVDTHESTWHRYVGWLTSSHPTDTARLAVVRTGRRAPRLDWSVAACCAATGERLLTRAHRAAHHAEHGPGWRCRLSWWRLLPTWSRPLGWPTDSITEGQAR